MAAPDGPRDSGEITKLLRDAAGGRQDAFDRLLPLVYAELHQIARHKLRLERPDHTLNTGALVHEAYLRLVDQTRVEWQNRNHFFAVASEAMRRVLVDYAKRRNAGKRGGGNVQVPLDEADGVAAGYVVDDDQAAELIALDDALRRLSGFNPDGARIVQYRFFGGLSNDEVAEVMGTSERTVRRAWTVARAWLRRELSLALDRQAPLLMGQDPGPAS
jgi:RNA polymerase sigma factor (TIGR02999 family)